jgi:DNA-binding winged helix-turn-helix (wHTH) protein
VRARFGQFTIDSDTRQLVRGGADVHLSPKAFDLLCTLIEGRPKVLEKRDLQARIWPDTHVVDANLNILIGEIRKAIGDAAERPEFIRTVHGVGYAFCGTVDAPSSGAAGDALFCWVAWRTKTFPLGEDENIIGRDPRCAVWVDAPGVSRRHARILVDRTARRVVLEDLDSTNGTFVGRSPVRAGVQLTDGDVIQVGAVELTIHLWATDKAPETRRIRRARRQTPK